MKNKRIYPFLFLFIVLFLMSCSPMRSSVKKGSVKLFETFYLGEKGTQYFIKPIYFEGTEKGKISMDFTFIYNGEINPIDSAIVNFSTFSGKNKKNVLILRINDEEKELGQVKQLFQDAKQTRFSTRVSLIDLKAFFENEVKSIYFGEKYMPKNTTLRKMQKINSAIFEN